MLHLKTNPRKAEGDRQEALEIIREFKGEREAGSDGTRL